MTKVDYIGNLVLPRVINNDKGGTLTNFLDALFLRFEFLFSSSVKPFDDLREEFQLFIADNKEPEFVPDEIDELIDIAIRTKFDFIDQHVRSVIDSLAQSRILLNYYQKLQLRELFVRSDQVGYSHFLHTLNMSQEIPYVHLKRDCLFQLLRDELNAPRLYRKDSKNKDWSHHIINSLASQVIFEKFGIDRYKTWNKSKGNQKAKNLENFDADGYSLLIFNYATEDNYHVRDDELWSGIERAKNYSYIAIIYPSSTSSRDPWQHIFRHQLNLTTNIQINKPFYRPQKMIAETAEHIREEVRKTAIDGFPHGLTYRDTFVCGPNGTRMFQLYEKNMFDEMIYRCHYCWSGKVKRNSYSGLGVRSFECGAAICPKKSKYYRGARYSYKAHQQQMAIENSKNEIPSKFLKSWLRDVQYEKTTDDVIEYLVRCYSDVGSEVGSNFDCSQTVKTHGRKFRRIKSTEAEMPLTKLDPLFSVISRNNRKQKSEYIIEPNAQSKLVLGDALDYLLDEKENVYDGAVTSPPYYNAREYSQWTNVYNYLSDMGSINAQVFRTLKPSSFYLYNVFDYFDNEKIIMMSDTGKQRIILGAYISELAQRAGFKVIGNIIWDKGNIHGKRGYNGGNRFPYYQAPFNCWEHIIILQKPPITKNPFQHVLKEGPVVKMIRGKNVYGHTAPFPSAIPRLLTSLLPKGSSILDPFGGSGTSGLAALGDGHSYCLIEKEPSYFQLMKKRLESVNSQPSLI